MKFVHIADIHLGMSFQNAGFGGGIGQERRQEIKATLMKVVEYCQKYQIDLLLIAGDLFEDDYVRLSELKDINHSFSKLSHTQVLISGGNHDPIMDGNSPYLSIDWHPNVHVFDTRLESIYLDGINTEVWGFSWPEKVRSPFVMDPLIQLDATRSNLLMLHGDVYQNNDYQYIDVKLIEGRGFDYVALGHIHKPDFVTPTMAYPGSLEPQDFSESGAHGFIEGTIDREGFEAHFRPFAKRSFHAVKVTVRGTMSFEGIYDLVIETLSDYPSEDFLRIVIEGDIDSDVDLDTELIKERLENEFYYCEVKDKTQLDIDVKRLSKEYKDTLIGMYIETMMAKDLEDPVVSDALAKGLRLLLDAQVKL